MRVAGLRNMVKTATAILTVAACVSAAGVKNVAVVETEVDEECSKRKLMRKLPRSKQRIESICMKHAISIVSLFVCALLFVEAGLIGCGADSGATPETSGTSDALTDSRDGQTYKTVKIGSQTWMAKNLNTEMADSWCYGNSADSCAKYGRLYTWTVAMAACPSGWHLPSRAEWDMLAQFVGGRKDNSSGWNSGSVWFDAGAKLKSKTGWNWWTYLANNVISVRDSVGDSVIVRDSVIVNDRIRISGNGTDKFGFSALPGGSRYSDGSFDTTGYYGNWWSAREYGAGDAYYRFMGYNLASVVETHGRKDYGFSVRCVLDDDAAE